MPVSKNQPSYFSFVKSARLWNRAESEHEPPIPQLASAGPSVPCRRFIAHMNASPSTLQSPWDLTSRTQTLQPPSSNTKSSTFSRDLWNTAVCPTHQSKLQVICHVPFKASAKVLPRSPLPSLASLVEEKGKQEDIQREAGLEAVEQNQADGLEASTDCGLSGGIWDGADLPEPVVDEMDRQWEGVRMGGTLSECSGHSSYVSDQGTEFSLDRHTSNTELLGKVSSCGGDSSTDLSHFRRSPLSWNSQDSEDWELSAGSSGIRSDRHRPHKFSPEASSFYQSMVNTEVSLSSFQSTGDRLQVSPSIEESSSAGRTPLFVEIWHDRVLKQWPVLPPISTQRDALETWSPGSPGQTVHSYSGLSAYEELDEIIPCTGSSLSNCPLDDTPQGVSESGLTERLSVSQTSWASPAHKSLLDMRLSLLDHPSCDHQQETHQLQKHLPQTMGAESQEKIASGEMGELDRSGFSAQRPSGNSSECKLGPVHQSNQEDMCQNSQTMMSDPLNNKAANVNGLKQSTRDRNPQCFNREALSPKETSVPKDVDYFISTESTDMEGGDATLSSVDQVTQLNEELDSISNIPQRPRESEASQMGHRSCHAPPRLSHNAPVEIERLQRFQTQKTKALRIFRNLRSSQASGVRSLETNQVSNIQNFNFLEKYCIFNREELALYKKKFREVDKDNDGYLTCAEVIMALREMVPFETLTDSEEIYIYRILESLDCHFIEGFANFQLFAVMVSLARKITKLEGFMRSLIGNMDFKALELRIDRAKDTGITGWAQHLLPIISCPLRSNSSCVIWKQNQPQSACSSSWWS
ncbi:uncharacterized protein LOC125461040 isoform X2 [Stegostoma tigrinum]|uniref:uncharacterized protein LOC125461040 isoform X2 n=1 Tax=Stegostoma tigrinum TaxID=3053191 RepID=UPI00202B1662|nr:uncharacterized protein LOC125461040 isoform X2 [Stegostoma tigrinum]